MSQNQTATTGTSIAARLRRGIFSLGAIAAIAGLCTVLGYGYINSNQTNTFKDQATQLKNIDQIAALSQRFAAFTQSLSTVENTAQLNALDAETQSFTERLDTTFNSLEKHKNDQNASRYRSELGQLLNESRVILNKAIEQSRLAFKNEIELDKKLLNITKKKEQAKILIENKSLDTNILFYNQARKRSADKDKTSAMVSAFTYHQRLAELDLIINRQFELLTELDQNNIIGKTKETEQLFRLTTQEFSAIATEIEKNEELKSFSRFLYQEITGQNTIFEIKKKLINVSNNKTLSLEKLSSLNKQIQEISTNYRHYVLESNLETTKDLQSKTLITSFFVILVVAISIVVYIYTFRKLIFNNLINPLMDITKATTKLGKGDLSVAIPKYDDLELRNMTIALDTFRRNSRLLEQSNIDLRKANADVEDFAYAASHDLKSPLRGISNLALFLQEDLEGKLDSESQDNLNEINVRAQRLETLLNDLLQYARSDSNMARIETLKTKPFLSDIFTLLNIDNRFSLKIDSVSDTLVTISTPLQQVMHNLIGNAIKHHDKERGLIQIKITESDSRYYFEVEDDGPGIPEKYQKRIFKLFQTLKPRDQVEGSGLGLSLIKKIIHSLDGEINVISNPETQRGSRFVFDWPKRKISST